MVSPLYSRSSLVLLFKFTRLDTFQSFICYTVSHLPLTETELFPASYDVWKLCGQLLISGSFTILIEFSTPHKWTLCKRFKEAQQLVFVDLSLCLFSFLIFCHTNIRHTSSPSSQLRRSLLMVSFPCLLVWPGNCLDVS